MEKAVAKWLEDYRAFIAESPERKRNFETRSGIPIKPLYTSCDLGDFLEERDLGFPGKYPFTRGVYPTMYRGRLWTRRIAVGLQTAEVFNRRQREQLARGQTGILFEPCNTCYRGYDCDTMPKELLGRCGVVINSLRDFEIAYEGIPLEKTSSSFTDPGPFVMVAMYFALAQKQGIPLSQLMGTTNQGDFLSHYVACHMFHRFPLEGHLRIFMDHVKFCAQYLPRWHPISVIGQHMSQAGATPLQELAFTLSSAIFYVSQCLREGLEVDDFGPRFSFFFDVSGDFFEEIAKFRAARRMWARIMRERFGAKDPRSWQCKFHSDTSGLELTFQQPLNNIVRACLQTLSAVLGGCQSIHTDSYDEAFWIPSQKGHQIALMTQNILAEETGTADVIDPLGGSYYVEYLTSEMERRAWEYIERIESIGGMLEAARKGYIQGEIAKSALKWQREIEGGERVVVGVNKYVVPEEEFRPEQLKIDDELIERQIERTRRLKRERDQGKASAALRELGRRARGEGNVFEAVVEAVKADVTQGEIIQELREAYGFGRPLAALP